MRRILRHLELPAAPPPIAPASAPELCLDLYAGDEYAQPGPEDDLNQDHPYPTGPDPPDDSDD